MSGSQITDNQATWEERARLWERRDTNLRESLSDGLFTHDLDGKLLSVNAAAERLSGFNREELLEMAIGQLLTADSYPLLLGLIDEAHAGNQACGEGELRTREGAAVP